MIRFFAYCLTCIILLSVHTAALAQSGPHVASIFVEGVIGPTTASYVGRALEESAEREAECIVIQLDTPGGLLDATQDIVQHILASPIPVIVYVAPRGASAGSAGVFITLAAHVAVMAPVTNIGAAHPVQMGGEQPDPDSPITQKMVNYAESYIETIAEERERNVEWARAAVRESASLTAAQAVEMNVIDFIAEDINDLLTQLHGREVEGLTLRTAEAEIVEIPMTQAEWFFGLLFRPEVMFILMLVAIYGILGELSNPGAIFPGLVGAIALILLLYTVAIIPVNLAGFALIILAIGLFALEVVTPSFGLLTVGGAVAFVSGSLMLFGDLSPVFDLSLAVIIPAAILTAAFFVVVVGAGIRAQFGGPKTGIEAMIGQQARAITPINVHGGKVLVEGELWNAVSDDEIDQGQWVHITSVEGLKLHVVPNQPQS